MDPVNPDPANIPDDDLVLQNYQDDLSTDSNIKDPIMDEESDDPTEELGVNPKEFKDELDKYDFGNGAHKGDSADDRREQIEDLDEDDPEENS